MSTPHTAANSDARKRQAAREAQPDGDVEALVRETFASMRARNPRSDIESARSEFDRWLAAHDAQVRREAWGEGVRDAAARIGVSPEGSLLDANPYARQEADR